MIQRQENKSKLMYTGVDMASVLTVNPSAQEVQKIYEMDETPEEKEWLKESKHKYQTENGEGEEVDCTELTIEFLVKNTKYSKINRLSFPVKNVVDKSKTGKICYVNQFGKTMYCDTKENLPSWFTKKEWKDKKSGDQKGFDVTVREAYVGERNLYAFLRAFLGKELSEFNQENDLLLDAKVFTNAKVNMYKDTLNLFNDRKVGLLYQVDSKLDQDTQETTYYQKINPYLFLTSDEFKLFNLFKSKNFEGVDELNEKGKVKQYALNEFVKGVKEVEAKKEQVLLRNIDIFDPTESPLHSNASVITDTNADY